MHEVTGYGRALGAAFRRAGDGPTKAALYAVIAVLAVLLVASMASAAEPTLLDAAESGDRATALRLLSKGADPNVPGPDGTTAVMWAAANDDVELVRALVRAGADVKVKNQFG